jgi:TRAP-type C4-dicarboxylate transport system substrate-binding protein
MKRIIPHLMVFLMAIGLIICGNSEAKTIKLRFGHDLPPFTTPGIAYDAFAKEVNEKAGGRLVVEIYPAGSLSDQTSALEMLDSGVADAYHVSVSAHRTQFPIAAVEALPGHGFSDTARGHLAHANAFRSLIKTYPVVGEEFKKYVLLFDLINASSHLVSANKVIRTPDDVAGLKVGCTGAKLQLAKMCGGAAVFDVPPKAYQSLQTGVIDVSTLHWIAIGEFKIFEVAKYFLDSRIDQSSLMCLMSKRTWDKLSAEDQKILREAAANAEKIQFRLNEERTALGRQKFLNYGKGRSIIKPTAAEARLWNEKYNTLRQKWVDDSKAAGVTNAQEILDFYKSLVDKGSD